MSHGRLTLPAPAIASLVRVCNQAFVDHHGTSKLTKGPQFKREGAVKGLVAKILQNNPNFDHKCVYKFIRCRTFARPLKSVILDSFYITPFFGSNEIEETYVYKL